MKPNFLLLLLLCTALCKAQLDTLRQRGSYIVCLNYNSNCKPGTITDSKRTAIGDTTMSFVQGRIVDALNEGIPFAEIRLTNARSKQVSTCNADLNGHYELWVEPGTYSFEAAFFRHKPLTAPSISLYSGDLYLLNASLGESCCNQTKTVITYGNGNPGYREEYCSDFSLCKSELSIRPDMMPVPAPWPDSVLVYWSLKQKRSASYYAHCRPTGTWSEWYQNGVLERRGAHNNEGLPAGTWSEWHPNGALKSSGTYDNKGQKNGAWTSWSNKGMTLSVEYYSNGQPAGTWLYYNYGGDIVKAMIHKSHNASVTKSIDRKYGVTTVTIIDLYRSGATKKTVIEPGSNKTTTEYTSEKGVQKKSVKRSKEDMGRYEYSLSKTGKLSVKKVQEP